MLFSFILSLLYLPISPAIGIHSTGGKPHRCHHQNLSGPTNHQQVRSSHKRQCYFLGNNDFHSFPSSSSFHSIRDKTAIRMSHSNRLFGKPTTTTKNSLAASTSIPSLRRFAMLTSIIRNSDHDGRRRRSIISLRRHHHPRSTTTSLLGHSKVNNVDTTTTTPAPVSSSNRTKSLGRHRWESVLTLPLRGGGMGGVSAMGRLANWIGTSTYRSWTVLLLSIILEIFATTLVKTASEKSSVPLTIVAMALYLISLLGFASSLRKIEVGVAYAIWAAMGTCLVSVAGVLVFGEKASVSKVVSVILIIMGVVGLNLGEDGGH